jgi:hypothetical protein
LGVELDALEDEAPVRKVRVLRGVDVVALEDLDLEGDRDIL